MLKVVFVVFAIQFFFICLEKLSYYSFDLLDEYSSKDIYDLFIDFKTSKTILKKHMRYFIENELVIMSDDVDCYSLLKNDFFWPEIIDTISIDIENLNTDFKEFLEIQINELGVKSLKLILRKDEIRNFVKISTLLKKSKIRCVVLYLEYSIEIVKEFKQFVIDDPRVSQVVFYNFNGDLNLEDCDGKCCFEKSPLEIIFDNKTIESVDDFVLNLNFYNEALQRNLMFNRSVYIDSLGNVKKHRRCRNVWKYSINRFSRNC